MTMMNRYGLRGMATAWMFGLSIAVTTAQQPGDPQSVQRTTEVGPADDRSQTPKSDVRQNAESVKDAERKAKEAADPAAATRIMKVFSLANANAVDCVKLLRELGFGDGSRDTIVSDARTNSVIVSSGEEASVTVIQAILLRLDEGPTNANLPEPVARAAAPGTLAFFHLRNAVAGDCVKLLRALGFGERDKIVSDARINAVIVETGEQSDKIEAILKVLDDEPAKANRPSPTPANKTETTNIVPANSTALSATNGGVLSPEAMKLVDEAASLEEEAKQLAQQIRIRIEQQGKDSDDVKQMRRELETLLNSVLEIKFKLERLQVDAVEQRLVRLKAQMERRKSSVRQIIERRASELIDADGLEWTPKQANSRNEAGVESASRSLPVSTPSISDLRDVAQHHTATDDASKQDAKLIPRDQTDFESITSIIQSPGYVTLAEILPNTRRDLAFQKELLAETTKQREEAISRNAADLAANLERRTKTIRDRIDYLITEKTRLERQYSAVMRDLELQLGGLIDELKRAEDRVQAFHNGPVQIKAESQKDLRKARLAFERFKVRYDLFKNLGPSNSANSATDKSLQGESFPLGMQVIEIPVADKRSIREMTQGVLVRLSCVILHQLPGQPRYTTELKLIDYAEVIGWRSAKFDEKNKVLLVTILVFPRQKKVIEFAKQAFADGQAKFVVSPQKQVARETLADLTQDQFDILTRQLNAASKPDTPPTDATNPIEVCRTLLQRADSPAEWKVALNTVRSLQSSVNHPASKNPEAFVTMLIEGIARLRQPAPQSSDDGQFRPVQFHQNGEVEDVLQSILKNVSIRVKGPVFLKLLRDEKTQEKKIVFEAIMPLWDYCEEPYFKELANEVLKTATTADSPLKFSALQVLIETSRMTSRTKHDFKSAEHQAMARHLSDVVPVSQIVNILKGELKDAKDLSFIVALTDLISFSLAVIDDSELTFGTLDVLLQMVNGQLNGINVPPNPRRAALHQLVRLKSHQTLIVAKLLEFLKTDKSDYTTNHTDAFTRGNVASVLVEFGEAGKSALPFLEDELFLLRSQPKTRKSSEDADVRLKQIIELIKNGKKDGRRGIVDDSAGR